MLCVGSVAVVGAVERSGKFVAVVDVVVAQIPDAVRIGAVERVGTAKANKFQGNMLMLRIKILRGKLKIHD